MKYIEHDSITKTKPPSSGTIFPAFY